MADPTGLALSVTSIKNLKHVLGEDEQLEKLNPANFDYDVFMEVLGVNFELAYRLSDFFYNGNGSEGLNELEGITPEIIESLHRHFTLQGS